MIGSLRGGGLLDIIKTIWEVGSGLFGHRTELEKAKRDQRDRAAAYFSDLARLIEETSAQLRRGKYPHGSCAELEKLAVLMPKTLVGVLPPVDLEAYRDKLLAVHEIERLHAELQNAGSPARSKRLHQLDEAAGCFRAVAAHLHVV